MVNFEANTRHKINYDLISKKHQSWWLLHNFLSSFGFWSVSLTLKLYYYSIFYSEIINKNACKYSGLYQGFVCLVFIGNPLEEEATMNGNYNQQVNFQ